MSAVLPEESAVADVSVVDTCVKKQGEDDTSCYQDDIFISPALTAVAKAVTGKHWNGFNFFRVNEGRGE